MYSPGSVFKVVMAIAGLSDGVVDPHTTFNCGGSGVFRGRRFRCWKKEGHGAVDVRARDEGLLRHLLLQRR